MITKPEESEPLELPVDKAKLRGLGDRLLKRFAKYKEDRKEIEKQWMRNLRQHLGKYDPEMESQLAPDQSRAYPKITRAKVVSMVSRLMSLLFPTDEKNWDLRASDVPELDEASLREVLNEYLSDPEQPRDKKEVDKFIAKRASEQTREFSKHIDDQLMDVGMELSVDYQTLVRRVVVSAVLFSVGVLKGPMTVVKTRTRWDFDANGEPVITAEDGHRPHFDFTRAWDYYPDLSARDFGSMDGQFERHLFSKHGLLELANRDDFFGDEINEFLRQHPEGHYQPENFENDLRELAQNKTNDPHASKYTVLEYWGYIGAEDLAAAGVEVDDGDKDRDVRATVWLLGGKVIKAKADPYNGKADMYHHFVFEEDEVNLLGSGLPPIVRDSQMAIANGARMLMDNAATVCGPMAEVDHARLDPDYPAPSIKAFSIIHRAAYDEGNTPVMRDVSFNSHLPDLLSVINRFKEFADEETFVGNMTGGDFSGVPGEAMRTSSGASMMMGAAALPFRDIVRNFDRFTVSVIRSLVQWNKIFHPEIATVGDVRPLAKGATTLIAKEVRAYALDNLSSTMTEEEKLYIDEQSLLKHRLAVRDLPLHEMLVSDDEVQRRKDARTKQQEQQADQQSRMVEAQIKEVLSGVAKDLSQAMKNSTNADTSAFQSVVSAIEKGIDPDAVARRTQKPEDRGPGGGEQLGGADVPALSAVPAEQL